MIEREIEREEGTAARKPIRLELGWDAEPDAKPQKKQQTTFAAKRRIATVQSTPEKADSGRPVVTGATPAALLVMAVVVRAYLEAETAAEFLQGLREVLLGTGQLLAAAVAGLGGWVDAAVQTVGGWLNGLLVTVGGYGDAVAEFLGAAALHKAVVFLLGLALVAYAVKASKQVLVVLAGVAAVLAATLVIRPEQLVQFASSGISSLGAAAAALPLPQTLRPLAAAAGVCLAVPLCRLLWAVMEGLCGAVKKITEKKPFEAAFITFLNTAGHAICTALKMTMAVVGLVLPTAADETPQPMVWSDFVEEGSICSDLIGKKEEE